MNFIGTGYAFDEIKSRIGELGLADKVTMHGVISDRMELSRYYAASDLFLFPSFYDNAPLVVREAAAMGTPSISFGRATTLMLTTLFMDELFFVIACPVIVFFYRFFRNLQFRR